MAFKPVGLRTPRSMGFGAALVACASIALAGHAIARIGPCKGSVDGSDKVMLLEAARRVFPPNAEPVVSNACGTIKGKSAEVATQRIPDGPTATHWWVTYCGRDEGDWSCIHPGMMREIEQRLVVDGIPRRVAMTLDADASVEQAKSLVSRAIHQYANPDSKLPYCGGIKDPAPRWRLWQAQHPLPDEDTVIPVTVTPQVTRGLVLFDNIIQPDNIKIEIQVTMDGGIPTDTSLPCYAAMGQ